MLKEISIVLVTYNSEHIISSFLNQPQLKKNKIYIVDNASSDKTTILIENNFKSVNLIKLKKNIGFGSAINKGLKKIKTKYALIINPDTFLSKTFFKDLEKAIKKYSNAGMIAPTIIDNSKFKNPPQSEFLISNTNIQPKHDQKTNFVHGACFLIDPSLFKNREIFDKNIFLFFEDNDLSEQVLKKNLDLIILGNCFVYHQGEKSSKKTSEIVSLRNFHYGWSHCYFTKKYNSNIYSYLFIFYLLLINLKRFLFASVVFNKNRSLPSYNRCKGIIAFIIGKKSKDLRDNI
jgi:N-acetylglucosaminyl-diphospho-decaprenol L-rhamnosyltransferase